MGVNLKTTLLLSSANNDRATTKVPRFEYHVVYTNSLESEIRLVIHDPVCRVTVRVLAIFFFALAVELNITGDGRGRVFGLR